MDLPPRGPGSSLIMAAGTLLALSTFPDETTARDIARLLVEGRLVACANILPELESIYRWQEKVESGREVLALFKLSAGGYERFEEKLRSLHPYEVPEIICVKVERGLPAYLRWVAENS